MRTRCPFGDGETSAEEQFDSLKHIHYSNMSQTRTTMAKMRQKAENELRAETPESPMNSGE